MKKSMFVIGILILLITGQVFCGGNKEPVEEPSVAFYATHNAPVINWDPSVEFSTSIVVLHNVYETLLRYIPETDTFVPVLATDYTQDDDLTWTFQLREDVTFHDGTPFNAEAVKFSIDRTMEMHKGAAYIWNPVKEVVAVDDYTVRFDLKRPAPMDQVVSCVYNAYIMSPSIADKGDDYFIEENECGTGPYKLRSSVKGDEVILERYDDYWGGWKGDQWDMLVFKHIGENASRRQMVESGEADVVSVLMPEDVKSLMNKDNVEVLLREGYVNHFAFFNSRRSPLDNVVVRRALSYAFPYEDVVKYARGGMATVATGPVPAGIWGQYPERVYTYDMDKARDLLAEAGYPDGGFKLVYTYIAGDEERKKTAELYKASLAEIGVDLEVRGMPWDSMWELGKSKNPEGQQDIFSVMWYADVISPSAYLYSLFYTEEDTYFNLGYYSNPEFDELLDAADAMSGIDKEKATKMFIDAQEIVIHDAVALCQGDVKSLFVVSNDINGVEINPAYPAVVFFYDTKITE